MSIDSRKEQEKPEARREWPDSAGVDETTAAEALLENEESIDMALGSDAGGDQGAGSEDDPEDDDADSDTDDSDSDDSDGADSAAASPGSSADSDSDSE